MLYATRLATLIVLALIFSTTSSKLNAQTEVIAPDTQLQNASQLALKTEYAKSLKIVQELRVSSCNDLKFAVRFIDGVVEMADMSDARYRSSFLNEAIKTANTLETSKACNGTGDAEFAYHYMVAMGNLAETLQGSHAKIAGQIFAAESRVASNLRKNPGFPAESKKILAQPMMSKAKAFAIRGDAKATIAAMKASLAAGFTNFEMLESDPILAGLKSPEVNGLIESSLSAYQKKLVGWARKSVDGFQSFKFKFDVADIEVGRVRESDYAGGVLIVDLWATWCAPCREAIPHFVKLDEEFRDENVEVLGISMDNPDDPRQSIPAVQKFVDKNGVDYVVAVGDRSVMNQLAPGAKLPTVLFIDGTGHVRFIASGPHNFYQLKAITDELLKRETEIPTSFRASDSVWK